MKKLAIVLLAFALLLLVLGACGEKADSEAALRALLEAEIKQQILDFKYDDYDGDGTFEAFAFMGEAQNPEEDEGYRGEIWFVNEQGAQQLEEASRHSIYWGLLDVLVFGERKFAAATTFGQTGGLVNVWGVKDGEPYLEKISGNGYSLEQIDDTNLLLWQTTLDFGYYDGILMGRTYKPYWFYWDGESFREYGGTKITKEQLRKCDGAAEILDGIYGIVGDIFYRGNGIININHTVLQSEGDINNEYVTLRLNGTKISIDDTYENVGGIYLSALAPDIAVYPDLPEVFA